MIPEAARLFALPPAEFVAERNRVAKSLKAAGRLEDSQFVAGMKRPKLSEHALNRLANEQPPMIDRLVTAIERAAQAQSEAIGGRSSGLREATAELRAATTTVVDGAVWLLSSDGSNGEGQRDEIVGLIRDFVATGELESLKDGVVGSSGSGADDYFRGAPDPPDHASSTTRTGPPTRAKQRARTAPSGPTRLPPPPVGPSPADKARKIGLERELRDAVGQVERSERAVAEAEEQRRQAQAKLDERTKILEARRVLVDAAQAALEDFRREWPN